MADEARAKERIEELKKSLSKAICSVKEHKDLVEFECNENDWNDDIIYVINEGLQKLGEALATFELWYDDESSNDD